MLTNSYVTTTFNFSSSDQYLEALQVWRGSARLNSWGKCCSNIYGAGQPSRSVQHWRVPALWYYNLEPCGPVILQKDHAYRNSQKKEIYFTKQYGENYNCRDVWADRRKISVSRRWLQIQKYVAGHTNSRLRTLYVGAKPADNSWAVTQCRIQQIRNSIIIKNSNV